MNFEIEIELKGKCKNCRKKADNFIIKKSFFKIRTYYICDKCVMINKLLNLKNE